MSRRSKQTVLQRRHTDGQKTHEKCSTSLMIRDMHIKTTMRHNLAPARMAIIKVYKQQGLERVWRKRNPSTLVVGL